MLAARFYRFSSSRSKRRGSGRPSLGRNFIVVRETWRIADDPAVTRPRVTVLVTGRSAAEAADAGRALAGRFPRHGFHKPTGRWWASDGGHVHRFSIRTARRGWSALLRPFGSAQAGGGRRVPSFPGA